MPNAGPLAGVQAALHHVTTPYIFVAACDMPTLDREVIRYLCELAPGYDAVIPMTAAGPEPLHGVYAQTALPEISAALSRGIRKIREILPALKVSEVGVAELLKVSAEAHRSFRNINTVADLTTIDT